jgi:hypothetical protein
MKVSDYTEPPTPPLFLTPPMDESMREEISTEEPRCQMVDVEPALALAKNGFSSLF